MQPETGLSVAGAAWVSKDLVNKILGPTADYLGKEVALFAQKCNINLGDIFSRAGRKLGPRLDEPGEVSPRVLKGVIDDGSFTEDSLSREYFAGVLASSRSQLKHDDRGVPILALVRELSALQMRLHYVLYELVRRLYSGTSLSLTRRPDAAKLLVFMPMRVVADAMAFGEERGLLTHCVSGLHQRGLVGDTYAYGKPEFMAPRFPNAAEAGVLLEPTALGAEVYLWAIGAKDLRVANFFRVADSDARINEVAIPPGSMRVQLRDGIPQLT
jgi:hypothetical protein